MKDTSYDLDVNSIDLNSIQWDVKHSYIKGNNLIKYSKAEHSPVSSNPSDSILLGTPALYINQEDSQNLVDDATEGKFIEKLNWNKRGSEPTEVLKQNLTQSIPCIRGKVKAEITYARESSFWLYCASIDPMLNHKRTEQMVKTKSQYNFMTKIENPDSFAEQLGHDIMKQININKDLKCDARGRHILFSASFGPISENDNYFIHIEHGPVVYLERNKKQEFINCAHTQLGRHIFLFVKDKKYEVQQEYRFVISVLFHSPSKDSFLLKVSDDLRKFMSPI